MKKSLTIALVLTLLVSMLVTPAMALGGFETLTWDDATATPDIVLNAGSYPRMDIMADGTLLLANSGVIRKSTDNGETWTRIGITQNAATSFVSSTNTTHTLVRENWFPYVMPNGNVMVAYRSRTSGYVRGSGEEFYTSIRVMTSTDGAATFGNEEILTEAIANTFNGYWEPEIIQIDDNTLALYYANDLDVANPDTQQNICYVTYNLTTGEWDDTVHIAVSGESRNSRDGMPAVTKLRDGGFAMVTEIGDYFGRTYAGTYYNSIFVIGLSLSEDGRTWSTPVPVAAPNNPNAIRRCAAPYIATLPDGRVIITYMCEDNYTGDITPDDLMYTCNLIAIISDDVITSDSTLTATTGGAAAGFTMLGNPLVQDANSYQFWNSVACLGGNLYVLGGNCNNSEGSDGDGIRIRRADVSSMVVSSDVNRDSHIGLSDLLNCMKGIAGVSVSVGTYRLDINGDGDITIADALTILREMING